MFSIFLILAGLVYWLAQPNVSTAATPVQPTAAGEWVTVKRGDFEVLCREEGELKPVKVTSMTFLRWGKISFLVPEGSYVKKGDKVVSLETKELEEEVSRLQDDVAVAERNLFQQEQNRDLEIKRLVKDLETEKERDAFADLKLRELLSKPLPVDKEEIENQLAGAKARLANAKADLEAYKPLAEKGFGKGSDLMGKELAVARAEVELQRTEMKYRITMGGALDYEKAKAKLERENAAMSLKLKALDVDDQSDSLNVKVNTQERALAHLKRRLDRRKLDLERSTLIAPHDGIAVYRVNEFRGNRKVEIGEYVGPWLSPIDLPSYDKMKVRTQVPESFINKIKARPSVEEGKDHDAKAAIGTGSKARVMVKTLPDRVYSGEVTWIDGWARDRNSKLSEADVKAQGLSGVRVFDVEVELQESDTDRLREGFRATVDFPVETFSNVISIPISAISNRGGATIVQVRRGGSIEWRKVELGIQSLDKVIVTANLQEGEEVFVPRTVKQEVQARKKQAEDDEETKLPPRTRAGGGSTSGGGGMSSEAAMPPMPGVRGERSDLPGGDTPRRSRRRGGAGGSGGGGGR
ncbi:MAG TPA: hypothetical protein VEK08_10240 [Planctomycetota bacterium]|nr:hypothetical protein [Planctomycetota bacterium]